MTNCKGTGEVTASATATSTYTVNANNLVIVTVDEKGTFPLDFANIEATPSATISGTDNTTTYVAGWTRG